MHIELFFEQPALHIVKVVIHAIGKNSPSIFSIPKWRPGRYELQQYPRLIADAQAQTKEGSPLKVKKINSHSWQIDAALDQPFLFSYAFYANTPDAGGSYYDKNGIYLNPINLLMYDADALDKPHTVYLQLPKDYTIACGLPQKDHTLFADNYHDLADAPLFAAPHLKHHLYEAEGIPFHLWFMGEVNPDFAVLERDFKAFSQAQIRLFGGFPVKDYHFLFYMLPGTFRHGVEHKNSTIIAMGPAQNLHEPAFYTSFLEISSHELFHTWNVKALRPADMLPYRYDQEMYSALHYITEGVTDFYGNTCLYKAGIWSFKEWIESINAELSVFYHNGGHSFISLEQSSFDSWVIGYKTDGFPNRKISFYNKGHLVAFIIDTLLRKQTNNNASLDSVMRQMYEEIACKGKGYTAQDYRQIVESLMNTSLETLWQNLIEGTADLRPYLQEIVAPYYGLTMQEIPLSSAAEAYLGIELASYNNRIYIANILPFSPFNTSEITLKDEIVSMNGIPLAPNAEEVLKTLLPTTAPLEIAYIHHQQPATTFILPLSTPMTYPIFREPS